MNEQYTIDVDTGQMIGPETADLKAKMKKANMQYDIKKSYEENKARYDEYLKIKQKGAQKLKEARAKTQKSKTYTYPFTLHYAGQDLDVSHIFEEGSEYSEKQITEKMLEHKFYEFSGSVSYEHMKEENVLIPIFSQHKKG